jgi:hypothetical protein
VKFKTKDLLVTVLPKLDKELAKACLLQTRICRFPTIECPANTFHCRQPSLCVAPTRCPACSNFISQTCRPCSVVVSCFGCSAAISGGCGAFNSCGPDGSVCDPTIFCIGGSSEPWVIRDLEDLATLRTELQETLKGLEEMARDLPSGITSRAEADALERSLTDALKHVQAAKKGLK